MVQTIRYNLLFWMSLLIATNFGFSQTNIRIENNRRVNVCEGRFLDTGGPGALFNQYANNEDITFTICPDDPGRRIQLTFTQFRVVDEDVLCFYDGVDKNAPLLSCWDDKVSQGGLDALFGSDFEKTVQSTLENTSGCITVHFRSNGTGRALGWSADISCAFKCQPVVASIASSTPEIIPVDTGWINVCLGESISLTGAASYPESGQPNKYSQSEGTSQFIWNLGDGTQMTGKSINHTYQNPGGYVVQLTVLDDLGCRNSNAVIQRVRVAPEPNIVVGDVPADLCIGDTIKLSSAVNSEPLAGKTITVTPNSGGFTNEAIRADSIALPDGEGVFYESSVRFSSFRPGQTITSASDIKRICVNMEHTWVRDLEILLVCPDGKTVKLHDFRGQQGNEVYLGVPKEGDNTVIDPGEGSTYCWTNEGTSTWLQYANSNFPPNSTKNTLPPGDYQPVDPFSNFIGCPINGEWKIIIKDLWLFDNGFVFWWSIEFDDTIQPNQDETFIPQISEYQWTGPGVFADNRDSIAAIAQQSGANNYNFSFTDEYGCAYDRTVTVNVRPEDDPECKNCNRKFTDLPNERSFCNSGETMALEIRKTPDQLDLYNGLQYSWSPAEGLSCSDCPNPTVTATESRTYTVSVFDEEGCNYTDEITFNVNNIPEIVIDNVNIVAPGCKPGETGSAEVLVSGGSGNFQYQWNDPNNQTTAMASSLAEGLYTVLVSDDDDCTEDISVEVNIQASSPVTVDFQSRNISCFGKNDGTITAVISGGNPPYNLRWSNGADAMRLTGLSPGDYELEVTDNNGCAEQVMISLTEPAPLNLELEVTPPSCAGFGDGMIRLNADGGVAPYGFQLDNSPKNSSGTFPGLEAGIYELKIEDAGRCVIDTMIQIEDPAEFEVFVPDGPLVIDLGNKLDIAATTQNNVGEVIFEWTSNSKDTISCADCPTINVSPKRSAVYYVTAIDENGCEATANIAVKVEVSRVIAVPTGFTPNQDGKNDVLMVHGKAGTIISKFQVFDRWGELVYETGDFAVNASEKGWDGTFRGSPASGGVYIWYIEVEFVDGYRKTYQGQTTLIR